MPKKIIMDVFKRTKSRWFSIAEIKEMTGIHGATGHLSKLYWGGYLRRRMDNPTRAYYYAFNREYEE